MISPQEYMHPEDAKALRELESIPGFPALVKKVLSLGLETLQYGINMASAIRLSPTQLPELYIEGNPAGPAPGRKCPSCHKPVDEGWKFCRYCGHPL